MSKTTKRRSCDKRTSRGVCREIVARLAVVEYCPAARAKHCAPGNCVHHPLRGLKTRLAEMKRGGINLRRYGSRLRDPGFVDKLYRAFLRARRRRSTTTRHSRSP